MITTIKLINTHLHIVTICCVYVCLCACVLGGGSDSTWNLLSQWISSLWHSIISSITALLESPCCTLAA